MCIAVLIHYSLQQARNVLDQTSGERTKLDDDLRRLQDELNGQRRKFEESARARKLDRERLDELLVQVSGAGNCTSRLAATLQLSNLEAEINLLKRRIALLEAYRFCSLHVHHHGSRRRSAVCARRTSVCNLIFRAVS